MKRFISILLSSLCISVLSAQTQMQVDNLAAFCKVWGFLKYYHPYPSKTNVDWDTVLTDNYPKVKAAKNKQEFNAVIEGITNMCRPLKLNKHPFVPADSLAINADFKWMFDTTVLSAQVCKYLHSIKTNHKPFKNKYIGKEFLVGDTKIKEKHYKDMPYPDEAYRFLALTRYWNIIDYYFPDKYLMDSTWNSSLQGAIPIFIQAKDTLGYFRALEWITARTNDSHALYVHDKHLNAGGSYKFLPVFTFYHNDTATVTGLLNDSIAKLGSIRLGDKIISIDGESIKQRWKYMESHHSASNPSYLWYYFGFNGSSLSISYKDSAEVALLRGGKVLKIKVKTYSFLVMLKMLKKRPNKNMRQKVFVICTDSLSGKKYGLLNMGALRKKQIDSVFRKMRDVDYLIIDCRNYPTDDIFTKLAKKILKGRHHVACYTEPDFRHPGYIKYHAYPWVAFFTRKVGARRNNYYKGNVIVLIDHSTQSAAEYQVMALQLGPDVKVIGTQTAGADGDVADVIFPGDYDCFFTGLGWFYADWKQTQRIGIVPDIKVEYSMQSTLNHSDPIMQRALQYIRTGK